MSWSPAPSFCVLLGLKVSHRSMYLFHEILLVPFTFLIFNNILYILLKIIIMS